MFRRIEALGLTENFRGEITVGFFGAGAVTSMSGLPKPHGRFLKNRRLKFFFTETGFRKFGHSVITHLGAYGIRARVIAVSEQDPHINVVWRSRDGYQIAITWCRWRKGNKLI